jgi:hypothetical protein
MVAQPEFEMHVDDVFRFSDGRTTFTGHVVHGPAFIPSVVCRLLVDGRVAETVTLEGEMLPGRRAPDADPPRRVVSTVDAVLVTREAVESHSCVLISP